MAAKHFLLLMALGGIGADPGVCVTRRQRSCHGRAAGAASNQSATPQSYTVPGMSHLVVGGPSTDSG